MTEDTIIKALTHYKVWMENMAGVYFTAGDLTGATDCVQAARDADKILSAWQSERSFAETLAKVQEMDRMLKGNNITESLAKAQAMHDELAGWNATTRMDTK